MYLLTWLLAALLVCSVQGHQLERQDSIRKTNYVRTTPTPGSTTEAVIEQSLSTATYRLQGSDGETCILLTVDGLIDISYFSTKFNERMYFNTFMPDKSNVGGVCKENDTEQLLAISFHNFTLEFSFAKTPSGERWYSANIKLSYDSSAVVLLEQANKTQLVVLSTNSRNELFPTPVGKSFFCPEETVIELTDDETGPTSHEAKLYLRQMRLQAFMSGGDGKFGHPWYSNSTRPRSEITLEAAPEQNLNTMSYRLQGSDGETCILLTVDELMLDISYSTKFNERASANTYVPNNAYVEGACKEGDAEQLVIMFQDFTLEFSFAKTPSGDRWYSSNITLSYDYSDRIVERKAIERRRVILFTNSRNMLFPTPVGKSFFCPDEETVIELTGDDAGPTSHEAKLYLRQMRLQAFMSEEDGKFGSPWCSNSTRARSETTPVN